MKGRDIFEELFVLELANNHWGDVDRGLKIISDFSKIVRFNNVKATIKLQVRDVDSFIPTDSVTLGYPLHQENARHSAVEGSARDPLQCGPQGRLHDQRDPFRREVS